MVFIVVVYTLLLAVTVILEVSLLQINRLIDRTTLSVILSIGPTSPIRKNENYET